MNATTNFSLQRLMFSITLTAGLLTAIAQPAAAHKIEFRPVVSNHYYYREGRHGQVRHGSRFVFPRWLRKNRDFQRWYLRSDYCCNRGYIRGANWNRLYDRYLFEKRHHRRAHRHFHGRVYIDLDRPSRRRHR